MQIRGQAQKVTIYIGESDKWQGKPLYQAILERLKSEDCAGATVTRALAGFGAHSRIHTANVVALSADLPLIIEWVDKPERIERVMPRLQTMIPEGLITVQTVEVVAYSHRRLRELPANLPVQDVMTREVHAVSVDTSLLELNDLLLTKIYRALPVIDKDRRVVGIVTEGDLLSKVKLLAASAQRALTPDEMRSQLQLLHRIDKTVAQVMTADPVTIPAGSAIPQAIKLMVERDVKRLPVVDADQKLVGMISRVDVLRALSQPPVEETPRPAPRPGHHAQVGEVMMATAPSVPANASLAEIVGLLVSNIQRRVVVVDERQRVVGIVTDGDLIKRAAPAERSSLIEALSRRLPLKQSDSFQLERRTAAQVMTSPVITVTPETPLLKALQLLLEHHIKRLPVVDEQGRLVGLIGRGGILQAMEQEIEGSGSAS